MKKISLWIESLRLSVTIPAAILVHISFILARTKTDWLLAIQVFLMATLAMLHNDYVDRVNDLKKGKRFAFDHPLTFKVVLIIGWSIVWFVALFPLIVYKKLLIPIILVSMFYSYTRKIPYLPNFLVAFASSSPLIFANNVSIPLVSSAPNSLMFMSVFFCIFGREIIKDIEDAEVDIGWKRTPVSLGWVSKKAEQQVASKFIGGGLGLCIFATLPNIIESSILTIFLYFIGLCFCYYSSLMLFVKDKPDLGKNMFDRGMMLILLSIIIS